MYLVCARKRGLVDTRASSNVLDIQFHRGAPERRRALVPVALHRRCIPSASRGAQILKCIDAENRVDLFDAALICARKRRLSSHTRASSNVMDHTFHQGTIGPRVRAGGGSAASFRAGRRAPSTSHQPFAVARTRKARDHATSADQIVGRRVVAGARCRITSRGLAPPHSAVP